MKIDFSKTNIHLITLVSMNNNNSYTVVKSQNDRKDRIRRKNREKKHNEMRQRQTQQRNQMKQLQKHQQRLAKWGTVIKCEVSDMSKIGTPWKLYMNRKSIINNERLNKIQLHILSGAKKMDKFTVWFSGGKCDMTIHEHSKYSTILNQLCYRMKVSDHAPIQYIRKGNRKVVITWR